MATEQRESRPYSYKLQGESSYRTYTGTSGIEAEGTIFRFGMGDDATNFTISSLEIKLTAIISRQTALHAFIFTTEPNQQLSNFAHESIFTLRGNADQRFPFNVSELGAISGNYVWVAFGTNSNIASLTAWPNDSECVATVEYTPGPVVITLTAPADGSAVNAGDTVNFNWTDSSSFSWGPYTLQCSIGDGAWSNFGKTEQMFASSYQANASIFPKGEIKWRVVSSSATSAPFRLSVTYPEPYLVPVNSPTSGNVNRSASNDFSVKLKTNGSVFAPYEISSATMYWRAGTSGNYTAVPMTADGNSAAAAIAGGTFPSGTIQWYAEAVDNTGASNDTEVFTILAVNAEAEAEPIAPINIIEAASSAIEFTWRYYTLDGSPQSRAVLEYSMDGESWETIGNVTGSGTTYTAEPGFFSDPGTVYWRVQAFNESGTAGPVSAAVSFLLFGAPTVEAVIGDGKPFATVQWQADEQVSYELMIGDKHIGPYFGADVRRYTVVEPLEDGVYTVKVRIENRFGIWSEWGEAEMVVSNQPGAGITIQSGESPRSTARITIINLGEPGYYSMVYRDGTYIGKTTQAYFDDRAAIGTHTYQVFQALPNGYVARSNDLKITILENAPVIAPLAGGDFIELRLSTAADRAQDIQRSREVLHVHYSGSRFPTSEIGEAETLSVSFDTAWKQTDRDAADAFEALVGEDVILKTPGGYVIVGTLEGYDLHNPRFYRSFRCALQQGDWRDFVNVT